MIKTKSEINSSGVEFSPRPIGNSITQLCVFPLIARALEGSTYNRQLVIYNKQLACCNFAGSIYFLFRICGHRHIIL